MTTHKPSGKKADILIIDDQPNNLRLLSQILNSEYKVRLAPSGEKGLDAVHSTPPDLILLDVLMPGLDGYEVASILKADEQTSDIPIIFISALEELDDKVRGFSVGGVDFITKPFQDAEVLARVKNHLSIRALTLELQRELDERKRAEAVNKARTRIIQFSIEHNVVETLQKVLDECEALTDSLIGFFHFLLPDQVTISLQAWSTKTLEVFCQAEGAGLHYDLDQAGVWASCVHTRLPVIGNHYASMLGCKGMPEGHALVKRFVSIPVMRGDKIVALIGVGNKETDYTERDVKVVSQLADMTWDIASRKIREEALRESEARIKTISDNFTEGMIYQTVIKPDGTREFTYLSESVHKLYGISPEEGMADPSLIYDRVHEDDVDDLIQAENEAVKNLSTFRAEVRSKDPSGQIRWISLVSKPIKLKDGSIRWDGIEFDITARKEQEQKILTHQAELQDLLEKSDYSREALLSVLEDQQVAENEIRKRLGEMEAVNHVSTALRIAQTLDEMLTLLLDETLTALESEAGAIFLHQQGDGNLHIIAARGWLEKFKETPVKPGKGIIGTVFISGKTHSSREFVSDTITRGDILESFPDAWGGVCAPIRTADKIEGVIIVSVPLPREITGEQTTLLVSLAEMAGTALHRLRLFEKTQADADELALAYETTLEGWAHALELRDQETEGHSRRVVALTLKLAERMGFQGNDLDNIRRGALLHDIGKMGVPDSILFNPGTLNEREWEIMRRHTEYARDMIMPIKHLHTALPIPTCHHEKWDGTGYPKGLKGDEIPLEARIFAIVDVWDALTSDRPYRGAWSEEETLKFIKEQSGKHFDPAVVDAFVRMFEDSFYDKQYSRQP